MAAVTSNSIHSPLRWHCDKCAPLQQTERRQGVAIAIVALMHPCVALEPAMAQDTRAEVIRQEQAERQQQLRPPQPNGVERSLDRLEDWGLITGSPRGFYPWFGSVYSGGGFAAGVGGRKPFGDDGALNIFGGYSINRFARAQADLALPTFARNHARITLSGRYIDAPDVRYFGVGNTSLKEEQTRFGYTPTTGGVRLDIDASKTFALGWQRGLPRRLDLRRAHVALHRRHVLTGQHTRTRALQFHVCQQHGAVRRSTGVGRWATPGSGGLLRAQFDDFRELRPRSVFVSDARGRSRSNSFRSCGRTG